MDRRVTVRMRSMVGNQSIVRRSVTGTGVWPAFYRWISRVLAQIGNLPDLAIQTIYEELSRSMRSYRMLVNPPTDRASWRPSAFPRIDQWGGLSVDRAAGEVLSMRWFDSR